MSHGSLPGRNEPLKKDRPKWKSDYPMTEGQLRSKRDEFWDTAPAFDGRKEIWDALKAAAVALECSDHELAQAIVDGASITLPHGEGGAHTYTHMFSHTRTLKLTDVHSQPRSISVSVSQPHLHTP
jgi:hypothetical protein